MIAQDFAARWEQMERRRIQRQRNRERGRVLVTVTAVNQPTERWEDFYIIVRQTARLQALLEDALAPADRAGAIEELPPNWLPQHGPQVQITEGAWDALGERWDWVLDPTDDATWTRERIEAVIQDLIQAASDGMLWPIVKWAGKRRM